MFTPISLAVPHRSIHPQPTSFLHVTIDGRSTYFEWINAAHYVCGSERGTMALVTKGLLSGVWFGFSAGALLIRVDTQGGPAKEILSGADALRVGFVEPADWAVVIPNPSEARPQGVVQKGGVAVGGDSAIEVACGKILELSVPFDSLGLRPGDPIKFYVEALASEASLDRAPREGIFELIVPSADFERIMWQV